MFTGLVAELGTVKDIDRTAQGARLRVVGGLELRDGDSVAVNGVCLTATAVNGEAFSADVMNETLSRTSLGSLSPGAGVNLELPLRASDRLGGHVVQGHVDGLGSIVDARDDGFARMLTIAAEPQVMRYLIEKGSIAVDGVSLTIAALDGDSFSVSLIPETLERTNLGGLQPGAHVNLEVDVLAKYVERLIGER